MPITLPRRRTLLRAALLPAVFVLAILNPVACGPSGDDIAIRIEHGDYLPDRGPYLGQTPPGLTAELFAPGIVSTGMHDDGPAVFSPDGRECWFRKYALPHDVIGHCRERDGRWTWPTLFRGAIFGDHVMLAPRFVPGGTRAFFNSRRPLEGECEPADMNIWSAEWSPDGWSNLRPLGPAVNGEGYDIVGSAAADGTLYMYGRYDDSLGGYDIYYSEPVDGVYGEPVNIGPPINSAASESAPVIAPDRSWLIVSVRGRADCIGSGDLFVSFAEPDGGWTEPVNLGPGVNTEYMEKFAGLSHDGKYLFFVSGRDVVERGFVYGDETYDDLLAAGLGPQSGFGRGDVYWVSIDVIEQLRPARN